MSEQETSQAIRAMAEDLTGLQTTGPVEKLIKYGKEGFKVAVSGGFLLCLRGLDGWDVGQVDQEGKVCKTYTSAPGSESEQGRHLIDLVLNKNLKLAAEFVFEKGIYEAKKEIRRIYYKSDIGKVILHTRHLREGIEGVIEVKDRMIILRFLCSQPVETGNIGKIDKLASVPF